jgi:hypothetical protein
MEILSGVLGMGACEFVCVSSGGHQSTERTYSLEGLISATCERKMVSNLGKLARVTHPFICFFGRLDYS